MLPTIEWKDDRVVMVDQRKLPAIETYVECKTTRQVARAIKTMVIRGAPALGVAAAMGVALGVVRSKAKGTLKLAEEFQEICQMIATTRPTAMNLFWAIERMKQRFTTMARDGRSVDEIKSSMREEALAVHDEDVANCRRLGRYGADVVPGRARVLTHCNAGRLATAGFGTALGVIRAAVEAGKELEVFADETRPVCQGARLTAWELVRDHIPTTVITDGMAGSLMRGGQIDLVIVGADRIAANGDVANKIGTYTVAVLAKAHDVPFYVAAPMSTVDLSAGSGSDIPIEQRDPHEVTHLAGSRLAPEGARIHNPAFDVTPSELISGIITECGILRAPFSESLKARLRTED